MKRVMVSILGIAFLCVFSAAATERTNELRKREVKELIAKASTPAEHHTLALYYEAKAKKYEADAVEHADQAKAYRARPTASEMKRPMSPDTAAHCDFLAQDLSKAAKKARELAADHEEMAKK